MIRRATLADSPAILTIAKATEMFLGDELDAFAQELEAVAAAGDDDPRALQVRDDGEPGMPDILGVAYHAPETMAQGVSNLLFLAVRPDARRRGVARALVERFEAESRAASARLGVIETAGDPMFAPAWALYQRHGYVEEARLRDYYDDGLDKLIFTKRF